MKKQAADLGDAELHRFVRLARTRQETKAEADVLFGGTAKEVRKRERENLERLFLQMPAASTGSPMLEKESAAKNVEAFFEKLSQPQLTEAQRRYPELLKAAGARGATPGINKKVPTFQGGSTESSGPTAVQSLLSRP